MGRRPKCHYNGSMVAKFTLRLPDDVAGRLHARSQEEGHSLNETTVRAIRRGLGESETNDAWWRALGDLVEEPPRAKFDLEEFRRLRQALHATAAEVQGLLDELEWSREDRFDR